MRSGGNRPVPASTPCRRRLKAGRSAGKPVRNRSARRSRREAHRARLIDQFEEQAGLCASPDDLHRLLELITQELGFQHFALLHHASLWSASNRLVRIHNYPRAWEEELVAGELVREDPVHLACARTNIGFAWEDLGTLVSLSRRHRQILERSRHHGIGKGFTMPVNIPGEPSGSCSFAVGRGRGFPAHRLMCAELIGAHAFRAARRIHGFAAPRAQPHLSPRQRECLRLVAAGKTDWEIAAILGLSVETARQYLKSARAAYDVVSRTQLVVHGLRDALISFDDAISCPRPKGLQR
jgi:LuxR family transcriptional regulator, quorum-sensing system regulator CciR